MLIMTKGQKQKPENFAAAVDLIVKDHHWEVGDEFPVEYRRL